MMAPIACALDLNSFATDVEIAADTLHEPASLTKLATLFLTFEALERGELTLDRRLRVTDKVKAASGSKLGLRDRATILVHDAVVATATVSANDAATCLAEAIGGSVGGFVRQMNGLCRRLGLRHTSFKTPTGLYCPGQVSTARDVAILAAELYRRFPHHAHWLAQRSFVFDETVRHGTNSLLCRCPDIVCAKTGRTPSSGWNMAVIARRTSRYVAAVVMGCATREDRDMAVLRLLDRVFSCSDSSRDPSRAAHRCQPAPVPGD